MDRRNAPWTVHDNGIGMSRQEVITNIGTIAKSGTGELMQTLKESKSSEIAASLIGQFGVGSIPRSWSRIASPSHQDVRVKRAARRWESTGDGATPFSERTRRFSHGTSDHAPS
jgi:molecular chaperone HtpG